MLVYLKNPILKEIDGYYCSSIVVVKSKELINARGSFKRKNPIYMLQLQLARQVVARFPVQDLSHIDNVK